MGGWTISGFINDQPVRTKPPDSSTSVVGQIVGNVSPDESGHHHSCTVDPRSHRAVLGSARVLPGRTLALISSSSPPGKEAIPQGSMCRERQQNYVYFSFTPTPRFCVSRQQMPPPVRVDTQPRVVTRGVPGPRDFVPA